MRLHERKRPSIAPSGTKHSLKTRTQYEVLGNYAKREVRPTRDDRKVVSRSCMRLHERKRPSIAPSGTKHSLKTRTQYEVLGNYAKREVRPTRDDRKVVSRSCMRLHERKRPSIAPSGTKHSLKTRTQYEVLGNYAKREVRPTRDDRKVVSRSCMRLHERKRPSIAPSGTKHSLKTRTQYEVLGNYAKREVRPTRDDRKVVSRSCMRLHERKDDRSSLIGSPKLFINLRPKP